MIGGIGQVYVSFDGHAVGVLQGKGVVAGLKANGKYGQHPVVAELNGGQEDGNSFLFKGGYDSVLKPLYANGTFKKGPDQFTPAWDNDKARTIFEQMLVKTGNKIDAVAAANDGLANAVVSALKAQKLKPIPLSGQDATPAGVQNILSGWQTMTVYKAVPGSRCRCRAGRDRHPQGQATQDDRHGQEWQEEREGHSHPADLDHEGELQAALHGQVPEEERGVRRRLQGALQVATN